MPSVWVACSNKDCAENGLPKDNSRTNYPVADIKCGTCQGPVKVTAAPKG